MRWTPEQRRAIAVRRGNCLVSASAGSGKTAVLTERAFQLMMEGTDLSALLILTFTKNAAAEMRERIRAKLVAAKRDDLAASINSASIQTFDAFALSLVRSYYYRLGVTKNVTIVDESVISLEKERIIEELFLKAYEEEDPAFLSLVYDYALKDDAPLKELILRIDEKTDLEKDKERFYDTYAETYLTSEAVDADIDEFHAASMELLSSLAEEISHYDNVEAVKVLEEALAPYLAVKDHDELAALFEKTQGKLPSLRKKALKLNEVDAAHYKALRNELIALGRKYVYGSRKTIKEKLLGKDDGIDFGVVPHLKTIFTFCRALDARIKAFMHRYDTYSYAEMARLARDLVRKEDIQAELRHRYAYIMIDEYQDTSDLQEELIEAISADNVFYVGDVKQSIYRFRNAEPMLFKKRYEAYEKGEGGLLIDLPDNFRSREELIADNNAVFSSIMKLKDADIAYAPGHLMRYGNKAYDSFTEGDYHVQVIPYDPIKSDEEEEEIEEFTGDAAGEKEDSMTEECSSAEEPATVRETKTEEPAAAAGSAADKKPAAKAAKETAVVHRSTIAPAEQEAELIVRDIIRRIEAGEKIIDGFEEVDGELVPLPRRVTYRDFAILLVSKTDFDIYRKVFLRYRVPLFARSDLTLSKNDLVIVLKNIVKLIIHHQKNDYSGDYVHLFLSLIRSFLYQADDQTVEKIALSRDCSGHKAYDTLEELASELKDKCLLEAYDLIVEKFEVYLGLFIIGDVRENLFYLAHFRSIAGQMEKMNGTLQDLVDYFDDLDKFAIELDVPDFSTYENTVRLLSIHASKGLEFGIVYLAGMSKQYKNDTERYRFDHRYGVSLPNFAYPDPSQFTSMLIASKERSAALKERARLFYVSMTRAKERVIIVTPRKFLETPLFKFERVTRPGGFLALAMHPFHVLDEPPAYDEKKPRFGDETIIGHGTELIYRENPPMDETSYLPLRASKTRGECDPRLLAAGDRFHHYLELIDFRTKDVSFIKDPRERKIMQRFLANEIFADVTDARIVREFVFHDEKKGLYGSIDLLIIHADHIDIIDYKLSNIKDEHYDRQLKVYQDYVSGISELRIDTYVVSILSGTMRRVV